MPIDTAERPRMAATLPAVPGRGGNPGPPQGAEQGAGLAALPPGARFLRGELLDEPCDAEGAAAAADLDASVSTRVDGPATRPKPPWPAT